MSNYILFSPVGGHDPIANYHDGAILHICRIYQPKKVYLYLSQEMLQRSDFDNRYVDSLERLQEHLGYTMEHIELIKRDDLKEVQLFDTFYKEFEPIIYRLVHENPESTILLNASSGTPAMKSALEIIAALSLKKVQAIQVSTPEKKENPKAENPMKYDLEAFWETNEDNEADYTNRCVQIESKNLLIKIKIESIKKLIRSYDYHAVMLLAEEIQDFLDPLVLNMMQAAVYRSQLDLKSYDRIANNAGFDFLPVKDGQIKSVVEYILLLQIKRKQGNYADFVRALSPVILETFDIYLRKKCRIKFKDDYCEPRGEAYYPKLSKMEASEQGRQIKQCLLERWNDRARLETKFYCSAQLLVLLKKFSKDPEVINCAESLRHAEEKIRNLAAHVIVSIREEDIKAKADMSSMAILDALKSILVKSGYSIKRADWESYEAMNETIVSRLQIFEKV